MPGTIRLIDTQGEIRDVPTESAAGAIESGWRVPTTEEQLARTTAQASEEAYGGVGGAIIGGAAALGRGVSAGTTDAIARLIGGDDAAIALEGYRDAHPELSTGLEIGGALAPALLSGGTGAIGALARATPAGAASVAGRAAGRAIGGGLRGALAAGVVEGGIQGFGAGATELALSTDDLTLERAASVLSSNALFGAGVGGAAGAVVHPVERGLVKAKALLDERMAVREAAAAVPGDLSTLDAKALRAVRSEELDRLAGEQVASRTAARSAVVDDVIAYRGEVQGANPWLALGEGEELAQLSKASKAMRLAIADDPKGLRESPGLLLKPLRKEEQAFEKAIARKTELASELDEIDARVAKEIEASIPVVDSTPMPAGRVTVDRVGRPSAGTFEARLPDGTTIHLGKGQIDKWAEGQMPPGFTAEGVETRRSFSIETSLPEGIADVADNAVYVVRPSDLARRGVLGNEIHPEHLASMRSRTTRIAPADVRMTSDGRLYIEDGNHRIQVAAETDTPVAIRIKVVDDGWKPQSGSRQISERLLGAKLRPTASIELTGRAARRYAAFSGVKVPKGGSIQLKREDAGVLLEALRSGRVASDSRRALDALDGLLDRNRALQAKLKEAIAPLAPKGDLASPRLAEIDTAMDVLRSPRQEPGLLEQAGRGAMFGAATGVIGSIPLIGQIPGVAHLIGAKAADTLTGLVFSRMGKAVSEVANRTAQAVRAFASTVAASAPYVPVVATKVLQGVRYGLSRDDDDTDDLPKLFKRRSDEVKALTAYDETGTPRVRPEVRAQIFERLQPIVAVDPIAADRLETAVVRRIEHVSGLIPRQPDFGGLAMPDWQPSDMEMRAWARSVAAAEDPAGVEERAAYGALSPEDVAAYWAVYPERAEDFKQSILAEIENGKLTLPYDRKLTMSMLLGQPLDPSLHPAVISVLQGQFPLEPGSAGGAQAPRAQPQFGSMSKLSDSAKTPAQERQS